MLEDLGRESLPKVTIIVPRLQRGEHPGIVDRIADDGHCIEVLRGGTQHCGPANIDLLDHVVRAHVIPCCGLAKRVKVHRDEIDPRNRMNANGLRVLTRVAAREQATVNHRVQRLYAAVEHLGELCQIADVAHVEPRRSQCSRGAAG